jgi:Flp pilus assembly protein TadD
MSKEFNIDLKKEIQLMLSEGIIFHKENKINQARTVYNNILKIKKNHPDALHLLGVIELQSKNYLLAINLFNEAILQNPFNSGFYNNLGTAFKKNKNPKLALFNYNKAIEIKPDYAEAYNNRGLVFSELQNYDLAIKDFDQAIKIRPDYAEAYNNRGLFFSKLQNYGSAINDFEQAIKIKPNYAEAYSNIGVMHKNIGDLESAIKFYNQSIKIDPNFSEAFFNKSIVLLLKQNFEEGLSLYESRKKLQKVHTRYPDNLLWDGKKSLKNKVLLIYSEQGLGDTIQFCRYIKLVADLGAKVIFEIPNNLYALLEDLEGVDKFLIKNNENKEKYDFQCPLLSLPYLLKTNLKNIPKKNPYLYAKKNRVIKWRNYLGHQDFKIGICWQGQSGKVDIGRSFPLSLFEKIKKIKNIRLVSLQKGEGADQLKKLPSDIKIERIDDFDSGQHAFLDTAAIMKCLNLVITSDTSVAHLAGALGVKTFLLLQHIPDWRWFLLKKDSPWYPNHIIFRQKKVGDWQSVFNEISEILENIVNKKFYANSV